MTKLYLTRHGQTQWNIEARFQGQMGSPLTQKGIKDAENLRDRLKEVEFQAIYSSPQSRAYDTANIIKGDRKINIITDDRLKEMNFGDWEGIKGDEIKKKYFKMFDNLWNSPMDYKPNSGESYKDVYNRVIPAIEDIKKQHDGKVLIVAHGIVLAIIMMYVEGRTIDNLWKEQVLPNTSLTIVEAENDKFDIKMYGDTSHFS
ncbi:histidine phosphatase family protein [Senegalia massiliensis]|uniref:histidine phosphatase family protein n=1 Tax=Senegalia massiliensis TaxID=1720316 RepID=UPI00103095FD|nr:histidine phosphatase family protein [Senegalia massiliensis]